MNKAQFLAFVVLVPLTFVFGIYFGWSLHPTKTVKTIKEIQTEKIDLAWVSWNIYQETGLNLGGGLKINKPLDGVLEYKEGEFNVALATTADTTENRATIAQIIDKYPRTLNFRMDGTK